MPRKFYEASSSCTSFGASYGNLFKFENLIGTNVKTAVQQTNCLQTCAAFESRLSPKFKFENLIGSGSLKEAVQEITCLQTCSVLESKFNPTFKFENLTGAGNLNLKDTVVQLNCSRMCTTVGSIITLGSTSCTPCATNQYTTDHITCQPCAAGSYLDANPGSSCTPCAAGYYNVGVGYGISSLNATACTPCPAGTASKVVGANSSSVCKTITPTYVSTHIQTHIPTHIATHIPTHVPTHIPTHIPTHMPTHVSTHIPTHVPTSKYIQTHIPTHIPTHVATHGQTYLSTRIPTHVPTSKYVQTHIATHGLSTHIPTHVPTIKYISTHLSTNVPTSKYMPTHIPTHIATHAQTHVSTHIPTHIQTHVPTSKHIPTHIPTGASTNMPTSKHIPTHIATHAQTHLSTHIPTHAPTSKHIPTGVSTNIPTSKHIPTHIPTHIATHAQTHLSTHIPTHAPTSTHIPTGVSTNMPTSKYMPTHIPTHIATHAQTHLSTHIQTHIPTSKYIPTGVSTNMPTSKYMPTHIPTHIATHAQTHLSTHIQTHIPTSKYIPTHIPIRIPTHIPIRIPTHIPIHVPTSVPVLKPTPALTHKLTPIPKPTSEPLLKPVPGPTPTPSHENEHENNSGSLIIMGAVLGGVIGGSVLIGLGIFIGRKCMQHASSSRSKPSFLIKPLVMDDYESLPLVNLDGGIINEPAMPFGISSSLLSSSASSEPLQSQPSLPGPISANEQKATTSISLSESNYWSPHKSLNKDTKHALEPHLEDDAAFSFELASIPISASAACLPGVSDESSTVLRLTDPKSEFGKVLTEESRIFRESSDPSPGAAVNLCSPSSSSSNPNFGTLSPSQSSFSGSGDIDKPKDASIKRPGKFDIKGLGYYAIFLTKPPRIDPTLFDSSDPIANPASFAASQLQSVSHGSNSISTTKGTILRPTTDLENWFSYLPSAIDNILKLRLSGAALISTNTKAFETAQQLSLTINSIMEKPIESTTFWPVVVRENPLYTHCIGIIFERSDVGTHVKAMDSDNSDIVQTLIATTSISIIPVAQQNYNNCVSETVENFAYYWTGNRAPEGSAVFVHSLLHENNLLTSRQQIAENQKLIGFLTNTDPIAIEYPIALQSDSHSLELVTASTHHSASSWPSSAFVKILTSNRLIKHMLLNYVYRPESSKANAILTGLKASGITNLPDNPFDLKRGHARSFHPDQGGSAEDFVSLWNFKNLIEDTNQLYTSALAKLTGQLKYALHGATVGLQAFGTSVDIVQFYEKPTLDNAKAVMKDSLYLYSSVYGVNTFSITVSVLSVGHTYHQEGFFPALQEASTLAAYMFLPGILIAAVSPHLALAYTASMALLTGYQALSNAYYIYMHPASKLQSFEAWQNVFNWCASKTGLELCVLKSAEYSAEINSIKANMEKQAVQTRLQTENTKQFGDKIFEHIYAPLIEMKYKLLNQGLPEAEAQKALQDIVVVLPGYSICRTETKVSAEDANEYYCAHPFDQTMHHVKAEGDVVSVIEVL